MSTATEISRLQTARNTIRNKMVNLGLGTSTDLLDDLAVEIDGISNQGAVSATVQEGDTYTIPAGYHNGSGTVSGVSGGGNYTLQSKSVTPTKSQQSVTADNGYYGLSGVTVAAIPEAYQDVSSVTAAAAHVLATKVFVDSEGVVTTGTMTNVGAVNKTLDATTGNQTYTVPQGYHSGSGTVKISLEEKNVTPSDSSQNVTPTAGKVLSKVVVAAVPAKYGDVTNDDGVAADVLFGKKVHSKSSGSAVQITGTMPNNGAFQRIIDTTTTYGGYSIPTGYHNGDGYVRVIFETKTGIIPSTTAQEITPEEGQVLAKVVVNPIPSKYKDASGTDAVALNVLSGKTFVNSTGVVTGSMVNNAAVSHTLDATANNQSYTVPVGYHNGNGVVNVILETKSITPSTSAQTIKPTDGKVLSAVYVGAIPGNYRDISMVDVLPSDVLEGKTYVDGAIGTGVHGGTMPNNGAVTETLYFATGHTSYTIPAGYHNGSGSVSIVGEEKTATPTTSSQNITPTSGKVLSKVTVTAIPAVYGDTTGDTATAATVLTGLIAHTISNGAAVQITGSMPNNGSTSGSFDGLTTTSYSIPAGYTTGGTVSLTSDIEEALAAI